MNIETVKKLNRINQHFYLTVAQEFDQTRQQPWQGWHRIASEEHFIKLKTVLDIGCGNGRLAKFSAEQGIKGYLGLDNNPTLLKEAQQYAEEFQLFKLKSFDIICTLIDQSFENDLVKELRSLPFEKPFLFCLFGVLHHIPSLKLRSQLFTSLSSLMKKDDLLVVSCWQFNKIPSLMARQTSPETLELEKLEKNDYLLDWQRGTTAFRYCHLVDDDEMKQIAKKANLNIIDHWQNDGKTNNLNNYYLLQKKGYNR